MNIMVFILAHGFFWFTGNAVAKDCVPPSFYTSLPRDDEWFYGVARDADTEKAREAAVRNLGKQVSGGIEEWDDRQIAEIAGPGHDRTRVSEAVETVLSQTPLAGWEQDDYRRCGGYSYVLVRVEQERAEKFLAENAKFHGQLLENLDKKVTQIGNDLESMKAAYAKLETDLNVLMSRQSRVPKADDIEQRRKVESIVRGVKTRLAQGQADVESQRKLQQATRALADLRLEEEVWSVVPNVSQIKAALKMGADPNRILSSGPGKPTFSVLYLLTMQTIVVESGLAKEADFVDALNLLFDYGMKIQPPDGKALYFPIANGLENYTRVLLEHGASATSSIDGRTPIEIAVARGHPNIADLLAKYGAKRPLPAASAQVRLYQAAAEEDVKAMDAALRDGASVNQADSDGRTALVEALSSSVDLAPERRTYLAVSFLLEHNADPNQKGRAEFGTSMGMVPPLYAAVYYMSVVQQKGENHFFSGPNFKRKIVEALLSAGAGVSGKDDSGRTPLHVAARWNGLEAAELLINSGALNDIKDNGGKTPLDLAESAEMIRVLQAHPSRLNEVKKFLGF